MPLVGNLGHPGGSWYTTPHTPRPGPGHEKTSKIKEKRHKKFANKLKNLIFLNFCVFFWPAGALGNGVALNAHATSQSSPGRFDTASKCGPPALAVDDNPLTRWCSQAVSEHIPSSSVPESSYDWLSVTQLNLRIFFIFFAGSRPDF